MATLINKSSRSSIFVSSPGKALATIPGHGINPGGCQDKTVRGLLNKRARPAPSRITENRSKRYFKKHFYKTNGLETGSTCSKISCFQSFKNRFSANSRACSFGRPFKAFPAQLGTNYRGSRDPGRCTGLPTRVPRATAPRTHSATPAVFARGVGQHRLRGCHPPGKRSVECISSVRSFQNGRHSPSARFTSASRLAGENRFERCILRSSDLERSQEIPSIHLEGLTPRVCLPPLWPVGGSEIVHKTFKAGGFSSSPNRNTSDNISGRSLVYEPVQRGSRAGYATAQYLLENLGFVINHEKSRFVPKQKLEFLGFVVDTLAMTLLLPDCKVESIKSHCNDLLALQEVSVRDLSQLIGKLTASIQAIFPGPLHYRHLQHLKHQALAQRRSYDSTTPLSNEAKEELRWWLAHLNAWNGRALLHPPPDIVIETDASRTGWGAVCQGVQTGGLWSQMERKLYINCLELLAGSFAVKSFTKNRLCVHVRLRMDNTSAVAYVNRLGGTRSLVLSNLALALWEWALSQGFFLSAEHLSGRLNIAADWQSRHFQDSSNWKLCPEVFRALMLIRGPCTKDLFADRLNAQLPQFFSWRPDPLALASDALQQDWSNERNYAFPPFCLIMRSLAKLREQGGELVLVTQVWPTQVWYPTLLDLSVSLPVLLPTSQNLLLGPQGQVHPLIANQTLFLAAWHVSNNPCNRKAFVQTLPSSSWQLGGLVQTQFITPPGRNGIAGVSHGKVIHFAPLWQI